MGNDRKKTLRNQVAARLLYLPFDNVTGMGLRGTYMIINIGYSKLQVDADSEGFVGFSRKQL